MWENKSRLYCIITASRSVLAEFAVISHPFGSENACVHKDVCILRRSPDFNSLISPTTHLNVQNGKGQMKDRSAEVVFFFVHLQGMFFKVPIIYGMTTFNQIVFFP
uniref:Uncharacterized protein n=1 Tax=Sphaerodactylus townsendi TaxID=933632 RepID=A0ACB8FIL9_9SAUR